MAQTRRTKAEMQAASDAALQNQNAIDNLEEIVNAEQLNPALQNLYTELGYEGDIDATVHISLVEKDRSESRIWRGQPSDYDVESLAQKFGSGEYRIKIYVRDPVSGKTVVRGNRVLKIRLLPEQEMQLQKQLQMMREPNQPMLPMSGPILNADTITQAIMAGIRAAMPPPPPPAPALDLRAMIASVVDVAKAIAPASAAPLQTNPLQMLRDVAGIMRDINPQHDEDHSPRGANGNDLLMKLVDKFAPMFQQVMLNAPVHGAVNAPVHGAVNAPIVLPDNSGNAIAQANVNPQVNVGQPPMGETMDNPALAQLKMGLSFLIAQADAGHDPVSYADVVMDNVPENTLDQLISLPDPVGYLAEVDPRVATHKLWFDVVFNEIRKAYDDADDEAGETGEPPPIGATDTGAGAQ